MPLAYMGFGAIIAGVFALGLGALSSLHRTENEATLVIFGSCFCGIAIGAVAGLLVFLRGPVVARGTVCTVDSGLVEISFPESGFGDTMMVPAKFFDSPPGVGDEVFVTVQPVGLRRVTVSSKKPTFYGSP